MRGGVSCLLIKNSSLMIYFCYFSFAPDVFLALSIIHKSYSFLCVFFLKVLLFSQSSPFLHQTSSIAAGIPTFSDLDLMVQCLASQFRLNHRNSHTFGICLSPESPPVFKLAFLRALHIVLKDVSGIKEGEGPRKGEGPREGEGPKEGKRTETHDPMILMK